YLEAAETDEDGVRTARLDAHARHLRDHVDRLAAKAYWAALSPSPEFVILFIPGEAFLAPALERDPGLLEYALGRKVHIATPTTLVTMLRTAQYAWQQAALAENARAVFDLGRQLYERISGLGGHVDRLGRALAKAVSTYNQAVGSLESRVLPSARKLSELGVVDGELTAPGVIEETPRALSAPELAPESATAPGLDAAELDGALIDPAEVSLVRAGPADHCRRFLRGRDRDPGHAGYRGAVAVHRHGADHGDRTRPWLAARARDRHARQPARGTAGQPAARRQTGQSAVGVRLG